jgi:hypothetical protein
MTFPTRTYTRSSDAIADFVNKAGENGLAPSASIDAQALLFAVAANLFDGLPASTELARAATLEDAGDIPANVSYVELSNETESTYAAVLVAPVAGEYGTIKTIAMGANDADTVTIDLTDVLNVPDADTLATFDAEDEVLALVGTPGGWLYVSHAGVTLSTP